MFEVFEVFEVFVEQSRQCSIRLTVLAAEVVDTLPTR